MHTYPESFSPRSLADQELAAALAVLLGNTVVLSFKAQGHHWNVVGPDFTEYHGFFQSIYEDVSGAIDTIAENIRKCESYAPYTLLQFAQLSSVEDIDIDGQPSLMCEDLLEGNFETLRSAMAAFDIANKNNRQGIADDIAERIGMHEKWDWQLKAHLTRIGGE